GRLTCGHEGHVGRQLDRQVLLALGHDPTAVAVEDRNRRAPVALARDQPVAQPVRDLLTAGADLLEVVDRRRDGRAGTPLLAVVPHAVERAGVDERARTAPGLLESAGR